MEEKNVFEQKLELFLHEYIAETVHNIRQKNPACKELVEAKALLTKQLQEYAVFWEYEEIQAQYVIVLTEAIYKQALQDFYFFSTYYLTK